MAVAELVAWLADSRYRELQPAHCAAIQPLWERAGGARLTELARASRITKQSMGALVDELERHGYVERVADPDDGRASRVRLTTRCRALARESSARCRVVSRPSGRRGSVRARSPSCAGALELLLATRDDEPAG